MTYTNEEFKASLEQYLEKKRAKQDARSKKCWFFRRICSDPAHQAKVDFVEKLTDAIDNSNKRLINRLVISGLNGKEGFTFLVTEAATSNLYGLLIHKRYAMKEESASRHAAAASIRVQSPGKN